MPRLSTIAACLLLALCCGCGGPPTLDGSSQEAFLASYGRLLESADARTKMQLEFSRARLSAHYTSTAGKTLDDMYRDVDGMSADAFIGFAGDRRHSPPGGSVP